MTSDQLGFEWTNTRATRQIEAEAAKNKEANKATELSNTETTGTVHVLSSSSTSALSSADEYKSDSETLSASKPPLTLVGGVDISFVDCTDDACAALVVVEYPSMKLVYEDYQMVRMTQPYIAGFLAFRKKNTNTVEDWASIKSSL